MSGRAKVLVAIWVGVFAVQAGGAVGRCFVEVGPAATLWLTRDCFVGWAIPASVVTVIAAMVWQIGWADRRPEDPGEPGSALPPPPA